MSAINKEKIFEELRNYHTEQFPVKIKSSEVKDLREEFGVMEDRIVNMILSLVNGKAEFVDSKNELAKFENKLKTHLPANTGDDKVGVVFTSKLTKLTDLMSLARESGFKMRPVRGGVKAA